MPGSLLAYRPRFAADPTRYHRGSALVAAAAARRLVSGALAGVPVPQIA